MFYSIALSKCNQRFPQCKVKSCTVTTKTPPPKSKDKQGGLHISSQSLNWAVLSGLCRQKWHQKCFCFFSNAQSLQQQCSHLAGQQPPLTLPVLHSYNSKLALALVSSCLRCFRNVAGLHITISKSGYSHRSEDCSMHVYYSSAFSLSTHSSSISCLLGTLFIVGQQEWGLNTNSEEYRLQ